MFFWRFILSATAIEPSLIAADLLYLGDEIKKCYQLGIRSVHLDVMDGLFVHNFAICPEVVAAIKRSIPGMNIDVHLMTHFPDAYTKLFIEKGADEVTFHLEATEDATNILNYIKTCKKKAGIAINPMTSIEKVLPYLNLLDKVLIMTVEPGFCGRTFLHNMLPKIRFASMSIAKYQKNIDVQVDGGINIDVGKLCIEAGANRLVSGSFFFQSTNKKEMVAAFEKLKSL